MLNIPIPMFMSIAVAAIPSIIAVIVAIKIKHKQKVQTVSSPTMVTPFDKNNDFSFEMQQQLFNQQIDTIFQSLSAIIESECIKLKMVTHSWSIAAMENKKLRTTESFISNNFSTPTVSTPFFKPEMSDVNSESSDKLGQQIADCMEKQLTPEEIAKQLNLSIFEVTLAMRMRRVRQQTQKNNLRQKAA